MSGVMAGLTCFLVPKPFRGAAALHQKNTLTCLASLGVDILVLGDEDGAADAALAAGARHLSGLARNERGTPLVPSAFALARRHARFDALCYLNADILFVEPAFPDLVERCLRALPRALLTGCRWDLDLPGTLAWHAEDRARLAAQVKTEGRRRHPVAMDYFVFQRDAFEAMPPFAIGRPGWDNWMVWNARQEGRPVVDLSPSAVVAHQAHGYGHLRMGEGEFRNGPESIWNRRLAGGYLHLYNLWDATHRAVDGRPRRRWWRLSPYLPYRWLMHATKGTAVLRTALRTLIQMGRRMAGGAA